MKHDGTSTLTNKSTYVAWCSKTLGESEHVHSNKGADTAKFGENTYFVFEPMCRIKFQTVLSLKPTALRAVQLFGDGSAHSTKMRSAAQLLDKLCNTMGAAKSRARR